MSVDQSISDRWVAFIQKLEAAELQFARGLPAAFKSLWSHGDDVSLYGAFGGVVCGWKEVKARLDWASSQYSEGDRGRNEISRFVGVDVAYIVQTEWIRARISNSNEPSLQELRVTMVLRREGDDWRIVHRHADPMPRAQT